MRHDKQQEMHKLKELKARWRNRIPTKKTIEEFRNLIWDYYQKNGRDFSWRQTQDPYHIVVSEIMLQQTQTYRVEEKYQQFIMHLPDFYSLAHASQKQVLSLWQGLGYNSRALRLQQAAKIIIDDFDGKLPTDPSTLNNLPGIGPATAASIAAFAFNKSTVFIETNIRAVFIHLFFPEKKEVHDKDIIPLVAKTLPKNQARLWYYALMDYGVMLKKRYKNPARKSVHHVRQSKFEGSDRQIRGMILKLLIEYQSLSPGQLLHLLNEKLGCEEARANKIISIVLKEQLIKREGDLYYI